jgi:hypothetical protein
MKNKILSILIALLAFVATSQLKHFLPVLNFESVVLAADMTKVVEAWLKPFERKATPTNGKPANEYEIKHAGSENILIKGGGEQIWADGVRSKDATVLEAKYIGNPSRSPYVPGSSCPAFIAEGIDEKTNDEFRRYALVINDTKTPVDKLEVITNEKTAVPYFNCLLKKHNITGAVIVKP